MSEPKIIVTRISENATTNLGGSTSYEGYVVYESDANEVRILTSATSNTRIPLGIIYRPANAVGGDVSVCVDGVCMAVAGTSMTIGTANPWLQPDSAGKLVPYTGTATTRTHIVCRSLAQSDVVINEQIPVLVHLIPKL